MRRARIADEARKPLTREEWEQVSVWMSYNVATARSCLLPRIAARLIAAETEIARLRRSARRSVSEGARDE